MTSTAPYLAWLLSSGMVTRCRRVSRLKTSALPAASTPQPKLTSAPRSEEKLWYEERRVLEKPSDRKAGKF